MKKILPWVRNIKKLKYIAAPSSSHLLYRLCRHTKLTLPPHLISEFLWIKLLVVLNFSLIFIAAIKNLSSFHNSRGRRHFGLNWTRPFGIFHHRTQNSHDLKLWIYPHSSYLSKKLIMSSHSSESNSFFSVVVALKWHAQQFFLRHLKKIKSERTWNVHKF